MKAIIFNSGIGSRMMELTKDNPKSLVKLYNGETILERQIRILYECGIEEIIITVGYLKNQIIETCKKFENIKFKFVENKDYDKTNYIVSLYNSLDYLNEDMLILHGDLVFNEELVEKVILNNEKSLFVYSEKKKLPEKDFKARIQNGLLKEISINIFDNDCYPLQPFYKLDKINVKKWGNKVKEYVNKGIVNCYAENALNEILPDMEIRGMSYDNDYIEEIDNQEDYYRVSNEIKKYDFKNQDIIFTENISKDLERYLKKFHFKNVFIVSTKSMKAIIEDTIKKININYTIFDKFSSNPKYEEVMLGVDEIKKGKFDLIISIGGGSTIDVAKCIKLFMDKNEFYKLPYKINKIKNIAIPTTAGTGSESTQFAVIYKNNRKYSIDNNHLLPEIVILNYKFLISLPEYYKKTTMLDALCQAIESYWCNFATDESKQNSENAIKMILENMDGYIENQKESLEKMLIASNYAGKAINVTRTTAPHAMSYKITDLYNVPHGQAVALCLPYVWEYMYKKYKFEAKSLEIARILKCNNVEDAIKKIKEIYSKMQFEKIHIKFTDIDILVNSVNIQRLENNPIKLNKEDLYEIYKMMINDIG